MTKQSRICVGVDGSDGATAASHWAVFEASRVGAGLGLVNGLTDYFPTAGFYAAVDPAGPIGGRTIATRTVCAAAQAVAPPLLMVTRRMHDFPSGHLGATAGHALLHEARCPVMVCRRRWRRCWTTAYATKERGHD